MTVAIPLKHHNIRHNPSCHSASGRPHGTYPETGFWEAGIVSKPTPELSSYEGLSPMRSIRGPSAISSFSDFVLFETSTYRCERVFPEIRSEKRTYSILAKP